MKQIKRIQGHRDKKKYVIWKVSAVPGVDGWYLSALVPCATKSMALFYRKLLRGVFQRCAGLEAIQKGISAKREGKIKKGRVIAQK